MRTIKAEEITRRVATLCIEANTCLPADVKAALEKAREEEPWPLAKQTLGLLRSNLDVAAAKELPICQDTGMACVFVELGQDVHVEGDLEAAVNEGVRRGYGDGYLRKSVVGDPLRRVNTGDNTPAFLTLHLVPGEGCRITVAPKGAGSENMSRLAMLKPADGEQGVKEFILDTVKWAGSNPCPPIVVGVGLGGRQVRRAGQKGPAAPAGCAQPGPLLRRAGTGAAGEDQRAGHRPPGLRRPYHRPGPCH